MFLKKQGNLKLSFLSQTATEEKKSYVLAPTGQGKKFKLVFKPVLGEEHGTFECHETRRAANQQSVNMISRPEGAHRLSSIDTPHHSVYDVGSSNTTNSMQTMRKQLEGMTQSRNFQNSRSVMNNFAMQPACAAAKTSRKCLQTSNIDMLTTMRASHVVLPGQ